MTIEPQHPKIDFPASATTIGAETVAFARRHSAIAKRLTRKQTARRIDTLKAMSSTISSENTAAARI